MPDRIIVYEVANCTNCGTALAGAEGEVVRRAQEIELPEKPIEVIEHRAIRKCCPSCQQVNVGEVPSHLKGNVQYGSRFKALCVYLMIYQLIPYERTGELLETLSGYKPAGGTLQSILEANYQALEPLESQMRTVLSQADVAHADETGVRVNGTPRAIATLKFRYRLGLIC